MNELMTHSSHLFQFDGLLHWCMWIGIGGFIAGAIWVVVRVLLPLQRLARQASAVMAGELPTFETPLRGIGEVEQLRRSLHYMIAEIRAAQARELAYRHALTESQENERKRVARDIHDDTIQSLVLVAHSIERATQAARMQADRTLPASEAVSPLEPHLDQARQQLIQTIDNLRQMIADLRPTILDELGLAVAIEALCEKHPALEFAIEGDVYHLDHDRELAIFRAAQEAIGNAERHARARRIVATLRYSRANVILEVRDDGAGFSIPGQLQEFAARGHYGLLGIRERMMHLGGQLTLVSERAIGTRLTVTVPTG